MDTKTEEMMKPVLRAKADLVCDKDGVPELFQDFYYQMSSMTFRGHLFDGSYVVFGTEHVCPSMGILGPEPSRMQYLQAINTASYIVLNDFDRFRRR